jgi:myosin heavy subunit
MEVAARLRMKADKGSISPSDEQELKRAVAGVQERAKPAVTSMLEKAKVPDVKYRLGKTKVFLGVGVLDLLESKRMEFLALKCTSMQLLARSYIAKGKLQKLKQEALRKKQIEEERKRREEEERLRKEEEERKLREEEERKRAEAEAKAKEAEEKEKQERFRRARQLSFERKTAKKKREEAEKKKKELIDLAEYTREERRQRKKKELERPPELELKG